MSESIPPNNNYPIVDYRPQNNGVNPPRSVVNGGIGVPINNGFMIQGAQQISDREQLEHILYLLLRRKWLIITCFVLAVAGSIAYSLTLEPTYETSSFVLIDPGEVVLDVRGAIPAEGESKDSGFDLFARSDRSLTGEIQLLQLSEELAQRVGRRIQSERESGSGMPPGSSLDNIQSKVDFVPERGSDNIIRFVGQGPNPVQATLLANVYAEEYVELTQEASRSYIRAVREALEAKERTQRDELDYFADQIKRFQQTGAIGLDQETTRLVGLIASAEVQRDDINIELEGEEAGLQSLELELESINPQLALRVEGIGRQLNSLQQALAEEEDTRSSFVLANPGLGQSGNASLRELDQRITQLKSQIDSLSVAYVTDVAAAGGISGGQEGLNYMAELRKQIAEKRVAISRLEARLRVLNGRIQDYQKSMVTIPEKSLEMAQLERSKLRAELVYQNTVAQLQEAYVSEESVQGYARIIRKARVPGASTDTGQVRTILVGGFLGLIFGGALAFTSGKIDSRIYQPEQLRLLGYRELGIVPDFSRVLKKEIGGDGYVTIDGRQYAASLVALHRPVSFESETYRHLRTNIHLGYTDSLVQTLVVTSPEPSEGKSTTASNLAIAMAQYGRSVLLIDADMRKPKLHRMFGIPRDHGLAEILTNDVHINVDTWQTPISNLCVLSAGRYHRINERLSRNSNPASLALNEAFVSNPSELLGSEQMSQFVYSMRKYFDTIIIDTPPILAATDASILSAASDATIVVVKAGSTRAGVLKHAMETIDGVGARVAGILLNNFDVSRAYGQKYKYQGFAQYDEYSTPEL